MSINESFREGQDIFSDLDLNSTSTSYHISDVNIALFIIPELLKLVACAASLGATIVLVYVFLKFERLKKGGNIYLLHYAFCNLTDLFFIPVYNIIHELLLRHYLGYAMICFVYYLSISIEVVNLLLAFVLSIEWVLVARNHKWVQSYAKFQKVSLIGIYSVVVALYFLMASECILQIYISGEASRIVYVMVLLMSIVLNVFVKSSRLTSEHLKTKYQLTIANCIIFAYLPLLISWATYLSVENAEEYTFAMRIVYFCETLSKILIYCLPVIVVYLLGRLNKHFKQAYDTIFKRSTKSYESNDLDGENSGNEENVITNNLT